jgi:hypothetical protein
MTRSSAHHLRDAQDLQHFTDGAVDEIRRGLERGDPPPLGEEAAGEICVFVSGHTHAPSLTHFGQAGALVNSGCWLRQLQPIAARFGAPPVFFSRFVQTHVRVYRTTVGLEVELWEHPRSAPQRLLHLERLMVAGRIPAEPTKSAPRVRERSSVERMSPLRVSSTISPGP